MKHIAFIPIRGGSQGIPYKNIKLFCGKPLVHWIIDECLKSNIFSYIIISTEDINIKQKIKEYYNKYDINNFDKHTASKLCKNNILIHNRTYKTAHNKASSESVILEFLNLFVMENTRIFGDDMFWFFQATNPFVTVKDIKKAYDKINNNSNLSLISCSKTSRFFWQDKKNKQPTVLNYDYKNRKRRQDFEDNSFYVENGSFYVSSIQKILESKNRISEPIEILPMEEYTQYEIDHPYDWELCELIFKQYFSYRLYS